MNSRPACWRQEGEKIVLAALHLPRLRGRSGGATRRRLASVRRSRLTFACAGCDFICGLGDDLTVVGGPVDRMVGAGDAFFAAGPA